MSGSEPRAPRVMRILTRPNLGGPTVQAIALWHAHRTAGVATLLVTGEVAGEESGLSPATEGVPQLAFDEALRSGPGAAGWVQVPMRRGIAPLADLRARAALRRLLASHRPDVVHTHTSKAGWLGRSAATAKNGPVLVHTFHGHVLQDYFGGLGSAWLRGLERRLARRTDVLVAVSSSCADELAAEGVAPRDRFVVVPPAVPPAGPTAVPLPRDEARLRLGLPQDAFTVACVGRLVPIKRVEHFVQMLALRSDWSGDVFGDGPELRRLAALAAATAGRVRCRGAVPGISSMLAAYDALVIPSVREGCPLVAVEAFAAGVPVVGYDVPGVRDVLSDWGQGLLVPVAAGPGGLAAAVERLRREPSLAAACVAAGRAALARFAPAAVAEQLLAAYRAALVARARYHAAVAE